MSFTGRGTTAIIPVKALEQSKSRLSELLSAELRADLILHLLQHLLAELPREAAPVVVTPDRRVIDLALRLGAAVLYDRAQTLNGALLQAAEFAAGDKLVLPVDLPFVARNDLMALLEAEGDLVIAPDRHGVGTNGLLVRGAAPFGFAFGRNSFTAHLAAAKAGNRSTAIVERDGLAFDLDLPADWRGAHNAPAFQGWTGQPTAHQASG